MQAHSRASRSLELARFEKPADPWSAALAAGEPQVYASELVEAFAHLDRAVVAEGAGGLMVPLNAHEHFGHIAVQAKLDTVIVVGLKLGCMNHTLLTLSQCEQAGIRVAGVVLVERWGPTEQHYRDDVERALQGKAKILGILPFDEDEATSVKAGAALFASLLHLNAERGRPLPHPTIEAARERVLGRGVPADRELLEALARFPNQTSPICSRSPTTCARRTAATDIAVEVLYNAKKGGCSEDCHFCSQSARFASDVEPEPLSSVEGFVAAARDAHERGAGEFCIVVAVRGPSTKLLERVCEAVERSRAELPLTVAVSLGILRDDQIAHSSRPASTRSITISKRRGAISHRSARRTRTKSVWRRCSWCATPGSRSAAAASSAWARRSTIGSIFSARCSRSRRKKCR